MEQSRHVMGLVCWLILFSTSVGFDVITNSTLDGDLDSGTLTISLLHRDHDMSPVRDTLLNTLHRRIAGAVKRSYARRQTFGLSSWSSDIQGVEKVSAAGVQSKVYSSSGEYVLTVSLGKPSRSFVAIMDTGSDLMWLQCKPCRDCFDQSDPLFDPTKSSTFKHLSCSNQFCKDLPQSTCTSGCSYFYQYGDDSYTRGLLASETATWNTTEGGLRSFTDLAFGCGVDNGGYFAGADGLIGFGRGPLSLPSQIAPEVGRIFSYCLGDFIWATNQSSSLTFGKHGKMDISSMKFTPFVSNAFFPTFYYIQLKSVKVGSKRLKINPKEFALDDHGNGGTIIDSGTTLTYLAQPAYDAILKVLRKTVDYPVTADTDTGLDLCFDVSENLSPELPTISFRFSDATMFLSAEKVFMTFTSNGTTLACLAMAGSGPGQFGIIGNYQQQNFRIVYDLERLRLGFTEQKCDGLVEM